jgi:hypothetical protein
LGHRSTSGFVWGSNLRTGVHLALPCSALGLAAACYSGDALAFSNNIGFGVGLYTDSAERTNESEPTFGNDQETDGSLDMETDSSLNLQLWYLRAPTPAGSFRILWGGGIAFYNDFSIVEVPEDDDGEEPEPVTLGNLFQVYAEGNMAIPLTGTGKFELLLGGRLGPMVLFQSRDLERDIEELSKQGMSVWPDAPRLGLFVGPHVGGLWSFSERVALRFDGGVQFTWLQLYSGETEFADGATITRSATLTSTRYQGLVGLQVGF